MAPAEASAVSKRPPPERAAMNQPRRQNSFSDLSWQPDLFAKGCQQRAEMVSACWLKRHALFSEWNRACPGEMSDSQIRQRNSEADQIYEPYVTEWLRCFSQEDSDDFPEYLSPHDDFLVFDDVMRILRDRPFDWQAFHAHWADRHFHSCSEGCALLRAFFKRALTTLPKITTSATDEELLFDAFEGNRWATYELAHRPLADADHTA